MMRRTAPTIGFRVLPQRIHYGWWTCIGVAVLMFATVGVGYYGLAVFLRPLQEENGWSTTTVSAATGMYFSISGITGFLLGPYVDRHGPRIPLISGVLLVGASAALLGSVTTVDALFVVYFLQAVAFGLAGAVPVNAIMARWFVTRRAQAMSISATGVSLGGIIIAPLASSLVDRGGVSLAAPALGAIVVVVGLPIALWVLVWDPTDLGLQPDVGRPLDIADNAALSDVVQRRTWTRREAASTLPFWFILIAFVVVLMAQTGFLLHQMAFLQDRLGSRRSAAQALSLTAFGSVVARLALGRVADSLDKVLVTALLFLVQAAAVATVTLVDNVRLSYLMVLIVGFTIGNIYMMQTLLVAEKFGLVSLGTVLGIIGAAAQIGSGAGPFVVGWLEDASGSYRLPFLLAAGATAMSSVIVLFARLPALSPVANSR